MKNSIGRLSHIDNLRIILVIMVVLSHVAITYSSFGIPVLL